MDFWRAFPVSAVHVNAARISALKFGALSLPVRSAFMRPALLRGNFGALSALVRWALLAVSSRISQRVVAGEGGRDCSFWYIKVTTVFHIRWKGVVMLFFSFGLRLSKPDGSWMAISKPSERWVDGGMFRAG